MKNITLEPQIKIHDLKTHRKCFLAVKHGLKSFELRKNDRDFQLGDYLRLREWDHEKGTYTGDKITRRVDYILRGGKFGLPKGYVVMQLFEDIYFPIETKIKR